MPFLRKECVIERFSVPIFTSVGNFLQLIREFPPLVIAQISENLCQLGKLVK